MKKLLTFLLFFVSLSSFAQVVIEGNGQKITLPAGTYTIKVPGEITTAPPILPNLKNCGCESAAWNISSIDKKSGDIYTLTFDACNVNPLNWKVQNGSGQTVKNGSVVPTSPRVDIDLSGVGPGNYYLVATSDNCNGEARQSFSIGQEPTPNPDKTTNGAYKLTPLRDPLAAPEIKTGNYVIRYVESRPDDELNLKIEVENGRIYLTDTGRKRTLTNYTLNGWSDPKNAGTLEREPIEPYKLYHVSKYSTVAGQWWRAVYGENGKHFESARSEVFFYVVPESETWNPAGDSNNPIGRPAAFARVPAFKLKNRVYGFEYDFLDESAARLDDLDITFNRKKGGKHLKLYASYLSQYLRKLPVRKGLEDLTEAECIDFANSLPTELIVAFDIEPGAGNEWIINYDGPNFARNMGIIIERLKERGAMAYNWLDVPGKSPNNIMLDNVTLGPHSDFGQNNTQIAKYKEAYSRLNEIQKRPNPYSLVSTGYGYISYDYNHHPADELGGNTSPQLTYLKALDASELWSRVFPEKEQVYFSWPFIEFNLGDFPDNYIVEIPEYNARARRTDNKPLYAPNQWRDNLILGLLRAKYLFYWSPGPVSWNPANTASYNDAYTKGFSIWTFEKGRTPPTDKFYIGKESMAVNATITAAYQFSIIQDAADGEQTAPAFSYARAEKDGSTPTPKTVQEITDGSWYVSSLIEKQPFNLVIDKNGKKFVLFQDVWARPGLFTAFSFTYKGTRYEGQTKGNELFIAELK